MPDEKKSLSVQQAAVWGAFLYKGLFGSSLKCADRTQWSYGLIELIDKASRYLFFIWDELAPLDAIQTDRPGVFEYEVISVFGELLGNYLANHDGALPDDALIKQSIKLLVMAFFSQTEKPPDLTY